MSETKELFLIIADISGYTAYMIRNENEAAHGTLVINELMKTLVKEVSLPIKISKLEGDALFLYLEELPSRFTERLLRFFSLFSKRLMELHQSTVCDCGACSGIEALNLKIVAHYGKASIEEIGRFKELSGVDVILVHRLLKNSVEGDCYLLMTEAAQGHLSLPEGGQVVESVERDKDLGEIRVATYYPLEDRAPVPKRKLNVVQRAKSHLEIGVRSGLLKSGLIKKRSFRNFPPA